jgi:hypothetical protein
LDRKINLLPNIIPNSDGGPITGNGIIVTLYLGTAYAQSQIPLNNSTISEEQQTGYFDSIDLIHGLFLIVAFIVIAIRLKYSKMKIRAWIAIFLVLASMGLWMAQRDPGSPGEYPNTNDGQRVVAITLVIIALIVLLLSRRTKKGIPWKKYKGLRRHFSGPVRQQVLDAQKYKCANCNMSIIPPLVHYDHIDGNHSNNDFSNCQALCPNCHSLKTDDDRRTQ